MNASDVNASIEGHDRTANWTFLTNHAAVLLYIAEHLDDTVLQIAGACGLRERITASVIADLRDAGYLIATRLGRQNHYSINTQMPLRRHIHANLTVKNLLDSLAAVESARRESPSPEQGSPIHRQKLNVS